MIRFLLGGLAACVFPAALGFAFQAAPPSGPRIDPGAQAILDRTVQTLGGKNFLEAKTLTTRGRVYAFQEGETAGLEPFESAVQYPDKRRFSYGKSKPVVRINDGDQGWEIDRYGLIRQTPEETRRWKLASRYNLENVLRQLIREPGTLIQLAGSDFVEGAAASVLELIDSTGVHVQIYVDKKTSLPIRIAYRVQNPQTKEWEEVFDNYSDFKPVQDIQTPMHIAHFVDGERTLETFRNSAEYNKEYPASYFQPAS